MNQPCTHIASIAPVPRRTDGCDQCVALGEHWVHLRACLECGHVGCCDQSKNKHARKHVAETGHPVVQSAEPGEQWIYCFADDVFVDPP